MRYEAFHICKPSTFIESLKAMEGTTLVEMRPTFYTATRDGAQKIAKQYGSVTIIPVSLSLSRPFINAPDASRITLDWFYEFFPAYKVLAIAGRFEHLLVNTSRWQELEESHGTALTLTSLYDRSLQDFLTLPLEICAIAEDGAIRNMVSSMGYDGFIYGGSGDAEGETIYYPLNTASIRYGSEEMVS